MHFHFRFLFIEVSVKTLRRQLVLDFLREKDRTGVLQVSPALVSMSSSESLPGYCTHSYSVSPPPPPPPTINLSLQQTVLHHTSSEFNICVPFFSVRTPWLAAERTPIHSLSVFESVSDCRFVPFILVGNYKTTDI